jgi:23S rRNA (adenine2503-C2)-methyltransferase
MEAQVNDLKDFTHEKLKNYLSLHGEKTFRASQIMQWVFQKGAISISQMTNLSKGFRDKLEKLFEIGTLNCLHRQTSSDGTLKFLFELKDKKTVESVYIPSQDRKTLCISTQVGCRMGCRFCLTARQGLTRNLTPSEIVSQVLEVQKILGLRMTNIVMMGMGEPFDNYENVMDAIDILRSPWAFNISQRKITVSTVGLIPQIVQFGKDSQVNLAISLNASNDDVRTRIMPVNKTYSIDALLESCRSYPLKKNRRLTFEYVLLGGINDSLNHAKELAEKIKGIRCKVNLIPFNEHPPSSYLPYRRPKDEDVLEFQKLLSDRNVTAIVRKSRGRDILAACGQLCSKSQEA